MAEKGKAYKHVVAAPTLRRPMPARGRQAAKEGRPPSPQRRQRDAPLQLGVTSLSTPVSGGGMMGVGGGRGPTSEGAGGGTMGVGGGANLRRKGRV